MGGFIVGIQANPDLLVVGVSGDKGGANVDIAALIGGDAALSHANGGGFGLVHGASVVGCGHARSIAANERAGRETAMAMRGIAGER